MVEVKTVSDGVIRRPLAPLSPDEVRAMLARVAKASDAVVTTRK